MKDDCVKIGLNRKRSDFVCQKGFIRQRIEADSLDDAKRMRDEENDY